MSDSTSKVVRISMEIYNRLEEHSYGFETPANVIEKLLDCYDSFGARADALQAKEETRLEDIHENARLKREAEEEEAQRQVLFEENIRSLNKG